MVAHTNTVIKSVVQNRHIQRKITLSLCVSCSVKYEHLNKLILYIVRVNCVIFDYF